MTEDAHPTDDELLAEASVRDVARLIGERFADRTIVDVEARLLQTYRILRQHMSEPEARKAFEGFASAFDLHLQHTDDGNASSE